MLPDDLMANIERLPLDEKMALLAALTRTINDELRQKSSGAITKRARAMLGADGPLPPFEELQGVLATDTPLSSEYDWKDDYTDYLAKKYA